MSTTPLFGPGVYPDMPESVYHADPVEGGSLSSTGARKLLQCPARFRHEQLHGQPHRAVFDRGHAAHRLVLGVGAELVPLPFDDWRTSAAREARDNAHADGLVPLLAAEHEQVQAMAEAIRRHPIAGPLFTPGSGLPELSLLWQDRVGVAKRARLDWLRPPPPAGGRAIIADYKTTPDASKDAIRRTIARYGYHQQGAWYCDAVQALNLDRDPAFLLVFQEVTAPYVVTVAQLAPTTQLIGAELNAKATALYLECTRTGHWPGYSEDIELVSLPDWEIRKHEEENL
ncbi:hypothetical protein GCM10027586_12890 [Kineococcus gypseus]|uniref:PD-(D/E)XK nuclease-like domain-containing protein n=1 Tax=Kineococcus gypseus TaxID=1637102 RepID=UPI003D7DF51B